MLIGPETRDSGGELSFESQRELAKFKKARSRYNERELDRSVQSKSSN